MALTPEQQLANFLLPEMSKVIAHCGHAGALHSFVIFLLRRHVKKQEKHPSPW